MFFDNEATRCTRCHTLGGQGGNAGPVLDGIGARKDRRYLLESLVAPSAVIAEGFGATTIERKDGTPLTGFVTKDADGTLTIVDLAGQATDVPWADIASRTPIAASAMPALGLVLQKRELRDLIAFLAQQKKE